MKCRKKDASLVEESEGKGEKYEWFHFDVPQYVCTSQSNKGKYKCKSAEEKELIPAYMFRKRLQGSVVGVKHIRIRRIDLNLNVEVSQDGDELRIWMSNDATRSNTFEEHKAVVRKCEVSAVSKHFLPRIGVKLDNLNWVYENKDTMGYKERLKLNYESG